MMPRKKITPMTMPAIAPGDIWELRLRLPCGVTGDTGGWRMEGVGVIMELRVDDNDDRVGVGRSVVEGIDDDELLLELLVVGMLDVVEDGDETVLTTVKVNGPVMVMPPMTRPPETSASWRS